MAESTHKQIAVRVTATVASTLIIAGLAYVTNSIPKILKLVTDFCSWFVSGKLELSAWVVCLLFLAAAVLLVIGFRKAVELSGIPIGNSADKRNYRAANYLDINWRWDYTHSGQITNLWGYCPNDKRALVPKDDYIEIERSTRRTGRAVILYCKHCPQKFGPFPGTMENLLTDVTREIDGRLNTDEWQQEMESAQIETFPTARAVGVN